MLRRRVFFVVYDGFELLDMAGPAGVFTTANEVAGGEIYSVRTIGAGDRAVCGAGVAVAAHSTASVRFGALDTVLMMGAYAKPLRRAMADAVLARTMLRASRTAARYGSVCTGAFVLAALGLLDGRRATTHWAGADEFKALFARVRLEPDALYVNDGALWTSAGVTTGIDMALAMLAQDHGPALMGKVAKHLVVYAHRPGGQSQFSDVIDMQTRHDGAFADLIAWLSERLDRPVAVADMAARAGLTERTFARKFTAAKGMAPGRFLETLRVDRARLALAAGAPVKTVAAMVGFRSEAAFRTLFTARTGVSPSHYARMNGGG